MKSMMKRRAIMSSSDNPFKQLMPALREFVNDRIGEDFQPQDISFALAYIATELGLHCTNNSTTVFPVVLRAMSHALDAHHSAECEKTKEADDSALDETAPPDAVLH
jgi:hypothetical protein